MQSNDASKMMFLFCVIGVGNNAHMIFAVADPGKFGEIEPQFLESFRSYVGKK